MAPPAVAKYFADSKARKNEMNLVDKKKKQLLLKQHKNGNFYFSSWSEPTVAAKDSNFFLSSPKAKT